MVLDKSKVYELVVKYNIFCLKIFFLNNQDELEEVIVNIEFLCILKLVFGYEYRKKVNKKAIVMKDETQLRKEFSFYRENGKLFVQEIIFGDNQCFYKVVIFYDD